MRDRFICTQAEMFETIASVAFALSRYPFKRNLNELEKETEINLIELIKSRGNHIGDPEAKMILKCLKAAVANAK